MKLFILNDDVNSFEHVTKVIQKYLNYPYMQGCSIASIVHNSGQCLVKESDDEELVRELYKGMVSEGLHLKIESDYE
jgi:ATP-dependent Clp protease adapter protein ClpS